MTALKKYPVKFREVHEIQAEWCGVTFTGARDLAARMAFDMTDRLMGDLSKPLGIDAFERRKTHRLRLDDRGSRRIRKILLKTGMRDE